MGKVINWNGSSETYLPLEASTDGIYDNWLDEFGQKTCTVEAGLPTSGDTVGGYGILYVGESLSWTGITFQDGPGLVFASPINGGVTLTDCTTQIPLSFTNLAFVQFSGTTVVRVPMSFASCGNVTFAPTCTIDCNGGPVLLGDAGCSLGCGATWTGNITIDSFRNVMLTQGWRVANGAAGGSIFVTNTGDGGIGVYTPENQELIFGDVNFITDGELHIENMPDFSITGSYLHQESILFPPQGIVTLIGNDANFNGQAVPGHFPDVAHVLTTDNVCGTTGEFNEAARNIDPCIANVKVGTAYKIANASLTGTLSASGGGRIIGG